MKSSAAKKWHYFFGTILLGSFAGIWAAQEALLPFHKSRYFAPQSRATIIQQGKALRPLLLGFENFFADLLWLQAIQYIGSNAGSREFSSLAHYVNTLTDFDPKFAYPYHFAGLILPSAGEYEKAEEILLKGEKNLPDEWQFSYDLGFLYFYYLEDSEQSIAAYERCIEKEGCLPAAKRVLGTLLAKKGKVEIAFFDLLEQLKAAKPEEAPFLRKKAEEIGKLLALQEITKLSPPENDLSELEGRIIPENKKLRELVAILEELSGTALLTPKNEIKSGLLENPFVENPFLWEKNQQTVRPKRW